MITLAFILCFLSPPDDGLTARFLKWPARPRPTVPCRPAPDLPDHDHPRMAPPPR